MIVPPSLRASLVTSSIAFTSNIYLSPLGTQSQGARRYRASSRLVFSLPLSTVYDLYVVIC